MSKKTITGDGLMSTLMYCLCSLSLLGTCIAAASVIDAGLTMFWAVIVSGFAGSLIFAAFGVIIEKAARTQALVEWMAREMQVLRNEQSEPTE